MIVLGIETSCDDTSAGIYDGELRSNVISTQLIHRQFGGVVPELASRSHIQLILPVIRQAMDQAGVEASDLEGIAVTRGPGLAGSLLVGLSAAKGIALSLDIPLAGINHLEGHIWANTLHDPELEPPFVILIASGGHTQLVHVKKWGSYRVMGRTRDDAAGEAFDKVSKLLGLGFPGGPPIELKAKKGDPDAIRFPRAFLEKGSHDFSFSGLKTAVLQHLHRVTSRSEDHLQDVCASFQSAVVDVLVGKTVAAAAAVHANKICIGGGVAVNRTLQSFMTACAGNEGISVLWPPPGLCTDNGGMIARAGCHYLQKKQFSPLTIAPEPSLNL